MAKEQVTGLEEENSYGNRMNSVRELMGYVKNHKKQLGFISESALLEESYTPYLIRGFAIILMIFSLSTFVMLSVLKVNTSIISEGNIRSNAIPTVFYQDYKGVVSQVFVREGQILRKGDRIFAIKSDLSAKELDKIDQERYSLELQAIRYQALLNETEPDFDSISGRNKYEQVYLKNNLRYEEFIERKNSMFDLLQSQINRVEGQINSDSINLERKKIQLEDQENAYRNLISNNQENRNFKVEMKNIQSTKKKLITELREVNELLIANRDKLSSLNRSKITKLKEINDSIKKSLTEAQEKLIQKKRYIESAAGLSNETFITAQYSGIITNLGVEKIGTLLNNGDKVFELLPVSSNLRAEIKVKEKNIAKIQKGQTVRIKVDLYNEVKYGYLEGKVHNILERRVLDKDAQPYYIVLINLENDYVGNQIDNKILPGMNIHGEVVVDDMSVLSYMLGQENN